MGSDSRLQVYAQFVRESVRMSKCVHGVRMCVQVPPPKTAYVFGFRSRT